MVGGIGGRGVGHLGGDLGNFGWGGVVFEPSEGVKRFDLQGGERGGKLAIF